MKIKGIYIQTWALAVLVFFLKKLLSGILHSIDLILFDILLVILLFFVLLSRVRTHAIKFLEMVVLVHSLKIQVDKLLLMHGTKNIYI